MEELDYHKQKELNEEKFMEILKITRPEIHLLAQTLDETGVNPFVIWRIIMAMHQVASDSRYGSVVVEIEDNIVRFVRGQHSNKVNEPIIKKREYI